jgi:Zn-dependent protease with chaperone function
MSALLLQAFVAWLLLLAGVTAAFELALPFGRKRLRRAALAGRSSALLALAWGPSFVAGALVAGCYAPGLLARLGWGHDHCDVHDGHIHLCVEHVRAAAVGLPSMILFAGAGAWLAWGAQALVRDLRRGLALHRTLSALAAPARKVAIVRAEVAWSLTSGLIAPRIFLTSALARALSAPQRRAIIAHEQCHARERHALVKLLAAVGALVLRPSTRRALLDELSLACERRSDEAAAAAVGDRLEVASTLLVVHRALPHGASAHRSPPLGTVAFTGSSGFEARIRELVRADSPALGNRTSQIVVLAGAASIAVGCALHHGVETLLSLVLG